MTRPFDFLAQATNRVMLHKPWPGEPHDYEAYLDFTSVQRLDYPCSPEAFGTLLAPTIPTQPAFPFRIGFIGYEPLAANFGVDCQAPRDLDLPAALFARPSTRICITGNQLEFTSHLPGRADELRKLADQPSPPQTFPTPAPATCNFTEEEYVQVFHQAREHILDGNTYQIKISMRYDTPSKLPPLAAFAQLAAANPAPEAFALVWDDFSLVSCSPETVIHKTGDKILTKPIGGTVPKDPANPKGQHLLADPKETAEHNMLIDLERNDLSNICLPGTVQIDKLRDIEHYAHLHHLVTTLSGQLRPGLPTQEILRSMLPGGTITGCPKHRTIQLIDQLEPTFRGPYTGSYGTFHDNGNLHLNLIIRTLVQTEGSAHIQAGGGIVVDSTPEYEYNENRIKAQALLDLLTNR